MTSKIRVALNIPFPADEVARFLFEPPTVRHWLGAGCHVEPTLGTLVDLPRWTQSEAAPEQGSRETTIRGRVTLAGWPFDAGAAYAPGSFVIIVATNANPDKDRISIRISPCSPTACRMRIQHDGVDPGQQRPALKVWQAALGRVEQFVRRAAKLHRRDRQAIILVHGIGEQRPGQLLREFVANVFQRDSEKTRFFKPDYVSPLFEMHTATVPRSDAQRPTTDVYELYWAHLIRDTTLAQVYGWLWRLLTTRDSRLPQTLVRLVWLVRILIVLAILGFLWLSAQDLSAWLKTVSGVGLAALPGILGFAVKALREEFVVGYAGDAARYLEPRAGNIARRQAIREAGATLLDSLHDKGRYSRIIVYGHSLGSVIAYDILGHAWTRRSRDRDPVARTSSRAILALEDLLNPRRDTPAETASIERVQQMQHEAWGESRRNGFKWRVSDFVTAGSPLAHAPWLLNLDNRTRFADLVSDRLFPTCPPQVERFKSPAPCTCRNAFTFTHAFPDARDPKRSRSVQIPHHGGLFALTRWTNLYFPYRWILDGDPVAGPLGPIFGQWVRDVRLRDAQGFAHTRYTDRSLEPDAVDALRKALNLPYRRPFDDYACAALSPAASR